MGRSHTILILLFSAMTYTGISQTANRQSADSISKKHVIDSMNLEILTRTRREMEFSDTNILINSAQFLPSKSMIVDGCRFQFALNFDANKADTVYWSTTDKRFVTPEGFSVGMTLGEIKKRYAGKLFKDPGWGYFMKLPSTWNLGFCNGASCTDKEPNNSTKAGWIFKKK